MSVLIKGMDMPRRCGDCPCYKAGYDDFDRAYSYCGVTKEDSGKCPFVKVPTPHGRLIDAEKFIDLLEDSFCGDYCIKEHKCAACGVNMIVRIVKNESTIIEAEVSE